MLLQVSKEKQNKLKDEDPGPAKFGQEKPSWFSSSYPLVSPRVVLLIYTLLTLLAF